ncbi:hypothetical protein G6F32_015702 [Rhizopus arrhizus]|nr:hypothetical protein G6F32_015702 [Rhizopus arrhizus]
MDAYHVGFELVAQCPQRGRRGRGPLDQLHMRHAARGRLESQGAAAGEQIQHLLVGEFAGPQVIQPVEQRLAHPVGRGAQRLHVGHGDGGAPVLATDDTNILVTHV